MILNLDVNFSLHGTIQWKLPDQYKWIINSLTTWKENILLEVLGTPSKYRQILHQFHNTSSSQNHLIQLYIYHPNHRQSLSNLMSIYRWKWVNTEEEAKLIRANAVVSDITRYCQIFNYVSIFGMNYQIKSNITRSEKEINALYIG